MEWRQERHTPGAESLALFATTCRRAEEGDEKVGSAKEGVPQRLKPQDRTDTYGTAEAVPLSKTRIFQHPLKPCAPTEEQRLRLFQQPVKPWAYPEAKAKPDV
jgi:hypothetical protein